MSKGHSSERKGGRGAFTVGGRGMHGAGPRGRARDWGGCGLRRWEVWSGTVGWRVGRRRGRCSAGTWTPQSMAQGPATHNFARPACHGVTPPPRALHPPNTSLLDSQAGGERHDVGGGGVVDLGAEPGGGGAQGRGRVVGMPAVPHTPPARSQCLLEGGKCRAGEAVGVGAASQTSWWPLGRALG